MKLSELFKMKLSQADSKYSLWNAYKCQYNKGMLFRNNKDGLYPSKCFMPRYNRKYLPIGVHFDFLSCEIIHDLISDAVKTETFI